MNNDQSNNIHPYGFSEWINQRIKDKANGDPVMEKAIHARMHKLIADCVGMPVANGHQANCIYVPINKTISRI